MVLAFVIGLGAPVILMAITATFTGIRPIRHIARSADREYVIVRANPVFAEQVMQASAHD
ncbi:hypothetical protein [Nocardia australiensis]|uniref:hypothetical protein n=1 Tax=Nocardia australiensis TaxID=2887191 RepID=UPI001D13FD3D|nr:hypothetical protein [Nocardia australiensis]